MFTSAERRVLLSLASAALPPGRLLAGAGEETIDRLGEQLRAMPSAVAAGARAGLWSLELGAVATSGARFSSLPLGRRLAALETFERAEASRLMLRGRLPRSRREPYCNAEPTLSNSNRDRLP